MNDTNDYKLESLAAIFNYHAEQAEKQKQIMINKYKEENPDQEVPDHLTNTFNIATALSVMVREIETLKHEKIDK